MQEVEWDQLFVPQKDAAAAMVRCNPRLMERLRQSARGNFRTLNAEIVVRLAKSLEQEKQEVVA